MGHSHTKERHQSRRELVGRGVGRDRGGQDQNIKMHYIPACEYDNEAYYVELIYANKNIKINNHHILKF